MVLTAPLLKSAVLADRIRTAFSYLPSKDTKMRKRLATRLIASTAYLTKIATIPMKKPWKQYKT